MPAITLNFSDVTRDKLRKLYKEVNEHFGEEMIDLEKLPHISLMRVKEDFSDDLVNLIRERIEKMKFMELETMIHGVGMFKKGENEYILYFRPTYNYDFQDIHQKIWKDIGDDVDLFEEKYYSPEHFSQHVTVHLNDQSKAGVLRVLNYLLDCDIHFLAVADKLAFIHTVEETGECKIYVEKQLDNLVTRYDENSEYFMEMYKKHLHKIGDRVTVFEDEEFRIEAVMTRNGIIHERIFKLTVPVLQNDE